MLSNNNEFNNLYYFKQNNEYVHEFLEICTSRYKDLVAQQNPENNINIKLFQALYLIRNDQEHLLSLCINLITPKNKNSITGIEFLSLINDSSYTGLVVANKIFILKILAISLNNDQLCTKKQILDFLNNYRQSKMFVTALKTIFKVAPFPSIELLNKWGKKVPSNICDKYYCDNIMNEHTIWYNSPVRREALNRFSSSIIITQTSKSIVDVKVTNDAILNLNSRIVLARDKTIPQLIEAISCIKNAYNQPNDDYICAAISLTAELLYRIKGLPAQYDPYDGTKIYGRSFEINDKQYKAIYQTLKTILLCPSTHVNKIEIDNDEGNANTLILISVCNYLFGNTINFTTDKQSSAIDYYLNYQVFFNVLNIPTSIIDSKISQYALIRQYKPLGINFADNKEHLCENLTITISPKKFINYANEYSSSYRGKAVIYKNIFHSMRAFFANIIAAITSDALWFPNLRAAWNKKISWSQFFFSDWGTPLPIKINIDNKPKLAIIKNTEQIKNTQEKDTNQYKLFTTYESKKISQESEEQNKISPTTILKH